MDKRTKVAFFCIAAILFLFLFLFLFLLPCSVADVKATDTAVTRALSTTYPVQGSTVDVSLNIKDLQIGGIVETIPDGFSFVSTTHPANQTSVSGAGQKVKVVFAVVNETSIKYTVRAPLEAEEGVGTRAFTGTWYDALNEAEGDIDSDIVAVRIKSSQSLATPPPTPTPTATPTPSIPGFEAIFTLAGLLAVAYPFLFMRKRKGERGDRR